MREINSPNAEECLWDAIVAFAGYPFVTEKGLPLKYTVEGGEINLTITQDDPFVFLFIIYWGVQKYDPQLLVEQGGTINSKEGVSCLLINTERGQHLVEKYGAKIESYPVEFSNIA